MKKRYFWLWIMAALLICSSFSVTAKAAEGNIASGVIEDGGYITWVIDANGKLTVEGTGNFGDKPWRNYSDEIIMAEINVTGTTDARYMFSDCSALVEIDVSGFDTSQMTDMGNMFSDCSSLTEIDLSGFDTSQVTDMGWMFYNCSALVEIDMSGFDTSQVTDMFGMFTSCSSLTELDLSGFDTSQVTNMGWMYSNCRSLVEIDVSRFDTSQVNIMTFMFSGCRSLVEIDVSGFDTSQVIDMKGMFDNCSSLTELDLSGFDTRQVTNVPYMYYDGDMFNGCSSLRKIVFGENMDTACFEDNAFYGVTAEAYYPKGGVLWTDSVLGNYGGNITWVPYELENTPGEDDKTITPEVIDKEFSFCDSTLAQVCDKESEPMKYTFHYDDSWFLDSSTAYNHELAQMSIRAAVAAYNSDTKEANGDNAYYIKSLMDKLGYSYDNDSIQYPDPNNWSIGYAIGSKDISEDTSVIMVAVRGGGYRGEWYSNAIVGESGDHMGFDQASIQVGDGIYAYVNKHSNNLKENIKVWIVGFSRGAAVANLAAADLCNGFIDGISSDDVFAYCFACPQGTVDKNAATNQYSSIKNIVNPIDFVTKVAMSSWGFGRYGVTYYLPFADGLSDYSNCKAEMKAEYDTLLSYNGIKNLETRFAAVSALTTESSGQASTYGTITRELASLVGNRKNYVRSLLQSDIASLADLAMGDGLSSNDEILEAVIPGALSLVVAGTSINDIIMQLVTVEQVYVSQNLGEQLTGTLEQLGKFKTLTIAHYPELYMAWLDSLEGEYRNHNGKYLKVLVNCPVDVTIVDETDTIVGKIVSDEAVTVQNGVTTYVDRDGQKVIILPCDSDYEVELTATGDGTMTYTVEEWDMDAKQSTRVTSYYDVEIDEGDMLTGVISEDEESEETPYILLDTVGNTITPTAEYTDDEVKTCTIETVADGHGTADATPCKLAGEYVVVNAIVNSGEQFLGWYEGEKRVSTEEKYRFRVEADTLLTARFTKINHDSIAEEQVVFEPTCTESGYTSHKCSICGEDYIDNEVEALNHSFTDYISDNNATTESAGTLTATCDRCSATDTITDPAGPIIPDEPDEPEEEEKVEIDRLYGATRYETGYKVADILKERLGIEKFDAVVVATGKNFADALSGSYLAVEKNAPIILTNGKDDNVATLHEYIRENVSEKGTIYILGGEAAVPKSVEEIDVFTVKRLAGVSRYDTNLAILEEAGMNGDELIVATGKSFADSLSASAVKLPILLVKPGASLSDKAKVIVENMSKIYIIGGEGAVSREIEAELKAYAEVERVFGNFRYETSVAVANTFFDYVEEVVIASGKNFPDGLCGGPLAAAMNVPLVLTADGKGDIATDYVQGKSVKAGYVLGGGSALSNSIIESVFQLNGPEEIIIQKGKCGEALEFVLKANGDLMISGSGPMYDWEDETQVPWHEERSLLDFIMISAPTHIGAYAFKDCTSITEIESFEWYNNVESIGAYAFEGCTGLKELFVEPEYMEKLTAIGESAFEGCTGLNCKIKVPENVEVLGENAFADCSGISSVQLSENITVIGKNAFDKQVSIICTKGSYAYHWAEESGLKVIDAESGDFEVIYTVMNDGTAQVIGYIGFPVDDMIIPDEIDGYKVTSIGEYAFSYMEEVTGNVYLSKNLKEIKKGAFAESNFNGDLMIPDSVEIIENSAFCRSGFDGKLTLSKNLKEIGSMAFNGCGFQGDLIIPDSVVKMGEDAFAFTGFANGKLVLSKNLTEIPFNCFHYSDFGGELVIPESVQMINDIAFIMCRNLTDVYVLSGTTQISNTAFIDFYGTPGGYDYEPKLNVTFHCPENSAVYERVKKLGYTVVPLED